tara:strand:- start:762 stop:1523 length:762 start_codon:yes stop_codon:yes gene_type:complete
MLDKIKSYIKNKYPKVFLLLRSLYINFRQTRIGAFCLYYFEKYILKKEIFYPRVETFASTWKNQLKIKKNDTYTNWRSENHEKKQNLKEIKKILKNKSKLHKCILDIGSYDGYFTGDYFDFKRIICADVFDGSGDFIIKKYGYHNDLSFIKINGYDLSAVGASSVDYVFCIDSLSRVPAKTVECYFRDLSRILRNYGEIFIHLPKNNIFNKLNGMTTIPKRKVLTLLKKDFESIQFHDHLDEMGYFVSAKKKI